jgi:hypothetical protein
MPGVERPDLFRMPAPDKVLAAAAGMDLYDVTVIGRDRHGQFYVASSVNDPEKCLGMLARATACVMQSSPSPEPYAIDRETK